MHTQRLQTWFTTADRSNTGSYPTPTMNFIWNIRQAVSYTGPGRCRGGYLGFQAIQGKLQKAW